MSLRLAIKKSIEDATPSAAGSTGSISNSINSTTKSKPLSTAATPSIKEEAGFEDPLDLLNKRKRRKSTAEDENEAKVGTPATLSTKKQKGKPDYSTDDSSNSDIDGDDEKDKDKDKGGKAALRTPLPDKNGRSSLSTINNGTSSSNDINIHLAVSSTPSVNKASGNKTTHDADNNDSIDNNNHSNSSSNITDNAATIKAPQEALQKSKTLTTALKTSSAVKSESKVAPKGGSQGAKGDMKPSDSDNDNSDENQDETGGGSDASTNTSRKSLSSSKERDKNNDKDKHNGHVEGSIKGVKSSKNINDDNEGSKSPQIAIKAELVARSTNKAKGKASQSMEMSESESDEIEGTDSVPTKRRENILKQEKEGAGDMEIESAIKKEGDNDNEDLDTKVDKESSAKKKSNRSLKAIEDLTTVDNIETTTRTPRAAATIAKTKLSLKGSTRTSTTDPLNAGANPSILSPHNNDNIISTNSTSKVHKQIQQNLQNRYQKDAVAKLGSAVVEPDPSVEDPWVQCETCNKWRRLPKHINPADLPEQWYCHMNEWDSDHNTCQAEEEVAEDTVGLSIQVPNELGTGKEKGGNGLTKNSNINNKNGSHNINKNNSKNSTLSTTTRGRNSLDKDVDSEGPQSPIGNKQNIKRNSGIGSGVDKDEMDQGRRSGGKDNTTAAQLVVDKVEWVECSNCKKWRKVSPSINIDSLPDIWYCNMNTWNPLVAKCSAKQEADTEAMEQVSHPSAQSRGESSKQSSKGASSKGGSKSFDTGKTVDSGAGSSGKSGAGQAAVVAVSNWVQCDRMSCRKWRKVPGYVDSSKFPASWYCEMNDWDENRAGCSVPEDSDSETDDPKKVNAAHALITQNAKGQNVPSYRRIIYGGDGKIKPMYAEKNNAGYGLFSIGSTAKYNGETEEMEEPFKKINYWWSSLHDESGVNFTISAKSVKKSPRADKKDDEILLQQLKDSTSKTSKNSIIEHIFRPAVDPNSMEIATDGSNDNNLCFFTDSNALKYMWPKRVAKCNSTMDTRTYFQKQRDLCTLIRNVFYYLDQPILSFNEIFVYILKNKMELPEYEFIKLQLDFNVLKDSIRSMEESSEVIVKTDSNGILYAEYVGYEKHNKVNTVIVSKELTDKDSSTATSSNTKGKKDKDSKLLPSKTSKSSIADDKADSMNVVLPIKLKFKNKEF